MAIIYVDSAYVGSEGAASGDLGHGTGIIFSTLPLAYAAAASGDYIYCRDDRVFIPTAAKFFSSNGVNGKRLIFGRYGNGTEIPFLDGSFYEDTVSGWSHIGSGVWQKTVGTGGTWVTADTMWVGATRPGTSKSSWVRGTMMRLANGNAASGFVNGNNPLLGNGIWYGYISGGQFIVQVWTGLTGAGGDPISVYGGLRFLAGSGSAGGVTECLSFNGAGSSDSEVHELALFGARNAAGGSVILSVSGTVNNLLFDSVQFLASKRGLFLQSQVADTYITNVELSGDWLADDLIDPVTSPSYDETDGIDHNNWESLSFDDRCQDVTVSGGLILSAGGHGAVSVAPTHGGADGSQQRPQRIRVDGTRARCDIRARYCRGMSVQNCDDVRISRMKYTGYGVASKAVGNRSIFTQNEWSYCGTVPANPNSETSVVTVPVNLELGSVSITFSNNLIDGRGKTARGATQNYGLFQFKTTKGSAMAAGAVVAECNVLLGDTGCAAIRVVNGSSSGAANRINPNQTIRSNWWNTGAAAVACYERNGGENLPGTAMTIAAYFTTGVTTGTVQKTLAEIAQGGGARPMTPMDKVPIDRVPFN